MRRLISMAMLKINAAFTIPLLSLLVLSCNESLPVYVAPAEVLISSVKAINTSKDTVNYQMLDENNPNLTNVRVSTPPFGFEIKVVNVYNETIQDDADVQGTLELTWIDKVEYTASVPLLPTGITGAQYDPVTKLITLNPGDTLTIRAYWDYRLTGNDWAFTKQQSIDGPPLTGGGDFFRYHFPMKFLARIKVKIFRSLSYVETLSQNDIIINFKGLIIPPP